MVRPTLAAALALSGLALCAAAPAFAYTDPFICLINQARADSGLAPVGFSRVLQGVAKKQAGDMAAMNQVTHIGA